MVRLAGFEPALQPWQVDKDSVLADFKQICKIDIGVKEVTANAHISRIRRFLEFCEKANLEVDEPSSIRAFLSPFRDGNQNTYADMVKSIRVFFREYLKSDIAKSFKVPQPNQGYVKVPSKEELGRFYDALPNLKSKALFLFYASSGRRRNEILNLDIKDVDFEKRMLSPVDGESKTKHTWFSFFNDEALEAYRKYENEDGEKLNGKLFRRTSHLNQIFKETSEKTGIKIGPQLLREWFCNEMGKLGLADRYVDAFCGRVPRSVLARHYTDFSPERLKEIYDKAGLKVLS
jgi:integrase